MNKYVWLLLAGMVFVTAGFSEQIKHLTPTGYVNDYANVISDGRQQELENKLQRVATNGMAEIAVVTIKTTEGEDIEGYAMAVATSWGVGEKDKDNGILILTAVEDRDIRIEVGYGLEGVLNDAKCGRIMDQFVIPYFKGGDYAGGIIAGVDAIIAQLEAPPVVASESDELGVIFLVFGIIIFLLIAAVITAYIFERRAERSNPDIDTYSTPGIYIPPSPPSPSSPSVSRPSVSPPVHRPSTSSYKPYSSPIKSFGGFRGGSFGGGGASRKW